MCTYAKVVLCGHGGHVQALRQTRLCVGASEEEVAEMQKVLEAWQTQAVR
jgi:hypothetical protein